MFGFGFVDEGVVCVVDVFDVVVVVKLEEVCVLF